MTRANRVKAHTRRTRPQAAWHGPTAALQRDWNRAAWPRPWTWQRHAACQNLGSALFFAPDGERATARRRREAAAKAVCERCPVRMPCALDALATGQPYGVWGGLAEDDRRQAAAGQRRRAYTPRGRPPDGRP